MLRRALAAMMCGVVALAGTALANQMREASAASLPAPSSRAQTTEFLAGKMIERFVFPNEGLRYAEMLRANQKAGKYDAIADDEAFAGQLTDDLLGVFFDGHLRVRLLPRQPAAGAPQRAPGASEAGVAASVRLTEKIAYLRLGNLAGEAQAVAAAERFMRDNADAETIIFDLRTNGGGGIDEMNAIFPYLFDKETVLVQMDTRRSVDEQGGNPFSDGIGLRTIPASGDVVRVEHFVPPHPSERRLADAKVFVLTSARTASAAEHFTLSLRRTKRATVIGEVTAGAGHYGELVELPGGFVTFIAVGRTFDPDTNKGWDDVGIAPNVQVPAGRALVEALVRGGVPAAEAERLSAAHGPSPELMVPRRTRPRSGPAI